MNKNKQQNQKKSKKETLVKVLNYLVPSLCVSAASAGIAFSIVAPILQIREIKAPIAFNTSSLIYMCNQDQNEFKIDINLSKLPKNKILKINIENTQEKNKIFFKNGSLETSLKLDSSLLSLDFTTTSLEHSTSFISKFNLLFEYLNTDDKRYIVKQEFVCSYGYPIVVGSTEIKKTESLNYECTALISKIDLEEKISSIENIKTTISEVILPESSAKINSISNIKIVEQIQGIYTITFNLIGKEELSDKIYLKFEFEPIQKEKYWSKFSQLIQATIVE